MERRDSLSLAALFICIRDSVSANRSRNRCLYASLFDDRLSLGRAGAFPPRGDFRETPGNTRLAICNGCIGGSNGDSDLFVAGVSTGSDTFPDH